MRLKELRTSARFTQSALAEKAGVDRTLLSKLEQGHRLGSIRTLKSIAAALGVPLSVLLEDDRQAA